MSFFVPDNPAAILDMVARLGPKLMRAGGGSLPCDNENMTKCKAEFQFTPAVKAKAIKLARTGRLNCTQIGKILGVRASGVRQCVLRAGIVVPDGRAGRVSKRRAA